MFYAILFLGTVAPWQISPLLGDATFQGFLLLMLVDATLVMAA